MPALDYDYQVAVTKSRLRLGGIVGSEPFQKPPDASHIETGWRQWLPAVGPRTFTGSFASFHAEFWDWNWGITQRLRAGETITQDDLVFLALWSRGFGKSSNAEWAAICEGALIGSGYVIYVSGTQALADGHVQSIRERLESDEVCKYYPHLGQPKVGKHGNQFGWRQDFLITSGGWAIRPLGLDVGVRGGRVGDIRPTLIVFDDVDSHNDSPLVVTNKLETIARSIIPAGARNTRIIFPQNLIHRNSVANLVYTRKTSVLSRRIVSGPYKAFDDLRIETQQTDKGPRNVIVDGRPTWPDMDLAACQKFLDDSGLEAFLAEYQHDFAASEQGRVIPEYDEARHVITWSQFEKVFGRPLIPQHWERECGHDVGFTTGHLSAWTWIATSAENSRLPGLRFRYRGMTFQGIGVDEQAEAVLARMADEGETVDSIQSWRMSHEALSERKTYRSKHDMPFIACDSGKTAGVSQWRHYLRADRTKAHPFHEDARGDDGLYSLGCPSWFDVVDDDQLLAPRDDRGLVVHRRQTISWRYRPDVLGVGGMSKNEPMKAEDDSCDSCRMITATWGPEAKPLTNDEQTERAMPPHLRRDTLDAIPYGDKRDYAEMARSIKLARVKKEREKEQSNWTTEEVMDTKDDFWRDGYQELENWEG